MVEKATTRKRVSKTTKRVVMIVVVAACASGVLLDRFVGNGQCRELVPQIIELAKDEDTRIVSLGNIDRRWSNRGAIVCHGNALWESEPEGSTTSVPFVDGITLLSYTSAHDGKRYVAYRRGVWQ